MLEFVEVAQIDPQFLSGHPTPLREYIVVSKKDVFLGVINEGWWFSLRAMLRMRPEHIIDGIKRLNRGDAHYVIVIDSRRTGTKERPEIIPIGVSFYGNYSQKSMQSLIEAMEKRTRMLIEASRKTKNPSQLSPPAT